ncbi:MAG TPA: hypothetical protein VFV85_10130 [Conexibacter sp.]|nr:hypothetical protein [Conexibacter sp.]
MRIVARRTPTRVRVGPGSGVEVRLDPDVGIAIEADDTRQFRVVDPGTVGDGNPHLSVDPGRLPDLDVGELLDQAGAEGVWVEVFGVTEFDARGLKDLARDAAERGQVVTIELA